MEAKYLYHLRVESYVGDFIMESASENMCKVQQSLIPIENIEFAQLISLYKSKTLDLSSELFLKGTLKYFDPEKINLNSPIRLCVCIEPK